MTPLDAPDEKQLTALREVARVGCSRAAQALSVLLSGRPVELDVPRVSLTAAPEMASLMGGIAAPVVAAALDMQGEISGQLLLVMPRTDAERLCAMLLNQREVKSPLDTLAQSAFGEAANIVASACLNAIGQLTRLKLLPSTPRLVQDHVGEVVAAALQRAQAVSGLMMVLEARFQTAVSPPVGGQFLVLPDRSGLERLLRLV
jgi:chemotaxis protein CheC